MAHDYNANWACALETFSDGSFLLADANGNIVSLGRRHSNFDVDCSLESKARMHFGEVVTCFARGSLTIRNDFPNIKNANTGTPLLFGCVFYFFTAPQGNNFTCKYLK